MRTRLTEASAYFLQALDILWIAGRFNGPDESARWNPMFVRARKLV